MADSDTVKCWQFLLDTIKHCESKFIPELLIKNRKKPKWLTTNLTRLLRKKQRRWNRYKLNRTSENYVEYKDMLKQVRNSTKRAKKKYEKRIAKQYKKLSLIHI